MAERERKAVDGEPTDVSTSVQGGDIPTGRVKARPDGKPTLTPAQQVLRNAAIVAAVHGGATAKEVGRRYKITARSVERIVAAFRERPTALDDRPVEIIERLLREYEQQMEGFAVVAEQVVDSWPAVTVGALKAKADSLERYTMLLRSVGKLPENLELFRTETEMRRFVALMLTKMRQVEDGEITTADAVAFFKELAQPARPLWDVEARELERGEDEVA
jgi:hypothetical protein